MAKLYTYVDEYTPHDNRFALYLGAPRQQPTEEFPHAVADAFTIETIHDIQRIPQHLFKNGLDIIINSEVYADNKEAIDTMQRTLAFWFCKYVYYPLVSAKVPDPLNLRKEFNLDLIHEINKTRNLPYHLFAPLTDRLLGVAQGRPLLLLMPGPSLSKLAGKLKELSKHCLIICVARTLEFCRQEGVAPDFVIQLDSHVMQRHLYEDASDLLEQATFVCFSMASIDGIAEKFRNFVFIDSFDWDVIENKFRPRESWLSSIMVCLGMTEVLGSKAVYVAGADLSHASSGSAYYADSGKPADSEIVLLDSNAPILISSDNFTMPDVNGQAVTTQLNYFAVAQEVEEYAKEMNEKWGMQFYNISEEGILSRHHFPPVAPESLMEKPEIERESMRRTIDSAVAMPEKANLVSLKMKLIGYVQWVTDITHRLYTEEDPKYVELVIRQCIESMNVDFPGLKRVDQKRRMAINMCEEFRARLRDAQNITALHTEQQKKQKVFMLCTPEDVDENLTAIKARHPEWNIQPMFLKPTVSSINQEGNLAYKSIGPWLERQRVTLCTQGVRKKFSYLIDILPVDNVLYITPETFL